MAFAQTPRTARSTSSALVRPASRGGSIRGRTPIGRPPSSRGSGAILDATRRAKMEALRRREDEKGDRRAKLEKLLTTKLTAKYSNRRDPESANLIATTVSGFMCNATKVTEKSLLKLEEKVKGLVAEGRAGGRARGATPRTARSGAPPLSARSDRSDALASARRASRASAAGGGGAPETGGDSGRVGEEWVMMAMYNKLQYEDKQRVAGAERHKEQAKMREVLAVCLSDEQAIVDKEKADMQEYHEQQEKELEWWRVEEENKEAEIKKKLLVEKEIRFAQIAEKKARAAKVEDKQRRDDQADIKRCVGAMQKEADLAAATKRREKAYLKEVLTENEKTRKGRESLWKEEADEDVRLMKEYARRLDKADADRAQGFEDKMRTSAGNEEMTYKLKAAERKRESDMVLNIAKYTKAREDREDARQVMEREKVQKDKDEMKAALDIQRKHQISIADKEGFEERKYAALYRKDGEDAVRERAVKEVQRHEKMVATRKLFQDQIKAKEAQGITSESLENQGMSQFETLMNKQMLDTIKNTPGMLKRIQAAMKQGGAAPDSPTGSEGPRDTSPF